MDINRDSNKKMKAVEEPRQTSCSGLEGDKVSPQDFALGIPDILEHILSFLNRRTLLECRFVSHQWRSVATKAMKNKKRVISITFRVPNVPPFVASTPSLRTVPELTSFIEETYTMGESPLDLSAFPCNELNFDSCLLLGDPDVQRLLNVYGKYLKNLCFCCSSSSEAQTESVFIQQVENLLGAQAPKLQHLELQDLKLTTEPADLHQITCKISASSLESTEMKLMKNKQLNFVSLDGATRRVIDCIVEMSPNLFEIELPNCGDFYLLIEPTNILHYVKKWDLNPDIIRSPTNNWMSIKSLEAALLSPHEPQAQNLTPMMQCTMLSIFVEDEDNLADYFNFNEDVQLSFERVINKILESSWNSLERIYFFNSEQMLKKIKWPRVMPKVKIILSEPSKDSCGLEIFPLDGSFNIQNTFPKIEDISFDVAIEKIMNSSAEDFLRKSKLGPISAQCVHVNIITDSEDRLVHLANMGGKERLLEYYSENLLNKLFTCGNVSVLCELPYPL